jgi:hypothetical protein
MEVAGCQKSTGDDLSGYTASHPRRQYSLNYLFPISIVKIYKFKTVNQRTASFILL